MPHVRVRDIEIYYEVHGAGPRLLFIGGSGGDLPHKPGVFDGPLPHSCEVLSYDQRGLGRSDIPDADYTMADYGEDALGLLDALGWERCAVMGVSFGGMVAQELACRAPERVERLVLACTSSGGAGGASYPLHELVDLPTDERARRHIALSDTRCDEAWVAANPERAAALEGMMLERGRQAAGNPAALAGARRQLEARRGHDTWDRLSSLTMPVLLCGGRYDGIAPPANLERIAERVPSARLEFFEGGHMFLIQDKRSYDEIRAFLLPSRAEA